NEAPSPALPPEAPPSKAEPPTAPSEVAPPASTPPAAPPPATPTEPPVDLGGAPPPPPAHWHGVPPPAPWAHHDAPFEPAEPRIRNNFSAKINAGPMYRSIRGHDVWGARFTAAFGAQFKDFGAIHGEFGYGVGRTDGGLEVQTYTSATTWEFILDRFRLGLGPQLTLLWMERVTVDHSMFGAGWGLNGFATFDLVQGDHANLYLGLDGRYTWLGHGLDYGGLGLTLGGRFKTP
ncbi:MAG: hypothetical protein RIF41_04970, partial [Polyangiaceae bacterium]